MVTVTDAAGDPVRGASILIVPPTVEVAPGLQRASGSSLARAGPTDEEGRCRPGGVEVGATWVVSCAGFVEQRVRATGESEVRVTLVRLGSMHVRRLVPPGTTAVYLDGSGIERPALGAAGQDGFPIHRVAETMTSIALRAPDGTTLDTIPLRVEPGSIVRVD